MKLLFEKSVDGRLNDYIADCDVPVTEIPKEFAREKELLLPQLSEIELSRHYTELAKRTHGVNDGMYPLGSCTMKYNPKVNDEMANLPGFVNIHPLQPIDTIKGALEVLMELEGELCSVTGMDAFTFQPAAGAHGEFTGLLLIKAFHHANGEAHRNEIIVPDSAHGTNPASCTMAGFKTITIPSDSEGCVDLNALKEAVNENTAGLMLTNPNTVGIFDKNILEITRIVHAAGGLNYYDGANLNAIVGQVRPGDMGFDVIHLNLHKSFSTPHGGGGPGSGAVGCKDILTPFMPQDRVDMDEEENHTLLGPDGSIGKVRSFYGNFGIAVRAYAYVKSLGGLGLKEASENAVLMANYMKSKLEGTFSMAFDGHCMHEFVATLTDIKKETGVSALDIAKGMLDHGIHPPTMYFPLIVDEALMFEPTETEPKEVVDETVEVLKSIVAKAKEDPEYLHHAPYTTPVGRLDEVKAAREPKLRYKK